METMKYSSSNAGDCQIVPTNNILLVISAEDDMTDCVDWIENFCGTVITDLSHLPEKIFAGKTVYLCGEISKTKNIVDLRFAKRVFIIRELSSFNHDDNNNDNNNNPKKDIAQQQEKEKETEGFTKKSEKESSSETEATMETKEMTEKEDGTWQVVGLGRVPILLHGVGVYYRNFFESPDETMNFFERIRTEHAFQGLTESTKPGRAHRTGIYLTPVKSDGDNHDDVNDDDGNNNNDLHFHLLRCSSNFSGPTDNFGTTDWHVVNALNDEADSIFDNGAPLNHVLAQIYRNSPGTKTQKQTKAKIKAHSDKTKDMPRNGIMAFCTFYDHLDHLEPMSNTNDPFDLGYQGISGLTKLHFRLKSCVASRPGGCSLIPKFSVTLYPNSVLFMPLSTNRLYTHEIRPSALDASMLPTRMGYVVRCSSTEAVHKDGQTFLNRNGNLIELKPPTVKGMAELRDLYAKENFTDGIIEYGTMPFSMNKGDYMRPIYKPSDEFRQMSLSLDSNVFDELLSSVEFERVGKGRGGAVLVKPNDEGRIPIVRTTTKYHSPAQCFGPLHRDLAQRIQNEASLPTFPFFNNALVEHYTNAYTTMGFHSDQDLDLEDNSLIALFSCYKYPELAKNQLRKLVIESKEPHGGGGAAVAGGTKFEIPLSHNSVIIFSLNTNRRFKHKIVLDTKTRSSQDHDDDDNDDYNDDNNEWIGITYRTSKTFVQFPNNNNNNNDNNNNHQHNHQACCFQDGLPLTLANEKERNEFYKLRRLENMEINFSYPRVMFTISKSDLMPPKKRIKVSEGLDDDHDDDSNDPGIGIDNKNENTMG